jgi:hypothetical protein
MGNKIVFTNTTSIRALEKPGPASDYVPEWYKKLESYVGGEKKPDGMGNTLPTIKRCMPVFDAITAGYIITLPVDVYVTRRDGGQWFEWASMKPIEFHPVSQAPTHPKVNGFDYPKFMNPWSIKTPKGYSTLFVQPLHRDAPFTILPGVVDTDTYSAAVHFPFTTNDPEFQGLLEAGTPIAQAIPFKRDTWEMEVGTDIQSVQVDVTDKLKSKFFDGYKNMFRTIKEFK